MRFIPEAANQKLLRAIRPMRWGREILYYLQVAETVRRRMKDGQYEVGELLPRTVT